MLDYCGRCCLGWASTLKCWLLIEIEVKGSDKVSQERMKHKKAKGLSENFPKRSFIAVVVFSVC